MAPVEMTVELAWPHEDLDMPRGPIGHTDKPKEQFRQYTVEDTQGGNTVKETYRSINSLQTVQLVKEQHEQWNKLDHAEHTMFEVIDLLAIYIDESDPDTMEAQQVHAFQTAERARELFPEHEFMALVGLIHDCGKIIGVWGQPQWATVGDTWPVGCAMAKEHTFSEFYMLNPDSSDPRYNTKHGMYAPNCGLDNVLMSFGHDEYLYQVLTRNNCPIPEEGLHIIRYHSFYAHHQKNAYEHLCDEKDNSLREWLIRFQKCDLYSKSQTLPDVATLRPYYQKLVDKYCAGVLKW